MNWNEYYKNKNISTRYKAQVLKRLEEVADGGGSIEVKDLYELAWMLGVDYDNRLYKVLEMLEKDSNIIFTYKQYRWIIDVIPF